MPFGGEGADDLIEDDDGELGEFGAASAVAFDDVASQAEEREDAVESGLLDAVIGGKRLRCDAGEQLDVKFPRGVFVVVLGLPFHL